MEARAGIEPANRGFAVPGITTLLPRHQERGRKYRQGNIRASKKACVLSSLSNLFRVKIYFIFLILGLWKEKILTQCML